MIVLKRKNRILTLRISDDDYQVLQEASLRDGARSLSDYARDSLFRETGVTTAAVASDLKNKMEQVAAQIDSLHRALGRLQAQISAGESIRQ
jgi:hypothetical protein